MLKFIKQKNVYMPTDAPIAVKDTLPAGIYDLILTPDGEIKFAFKFDKFVEPERYYGDKTHDVANYVQEDYENTAGVAAALFNGTSGMGKTMAAKYIANRYMETESKPVIRIYNRLPASLYKAVLEITGGCCILIDEYEKINYVSQDSNEDPNNDPLLSVLDDESLPHSLAILTTNSTAHISNYLLNRPGRIGTLVSYTHLDQTEVDEYLDINCNEQVCEKITAFIRTVGKQLSFDELVKVVNDANRSADEMAFVKRLRFSNTHIGPINVRVNLDTEETESLKECTATWSFDGGHLKAIINVNGESHVITNTNTQLTLNGVSVKAYLAIGIVFVNGDIEGIIATNSKPGLVAVNTAQPQFDNALTGEAHRPPQPDTPAPQYRPSTRSINAGRGVMPTY